LINLERFPSMNDMTATAHSLKMTASWYLNNDPCNGTKEQAVGPTYTQDSSDALKYGFDGVKFDSQAHGPSHNITMWAMALNVAGEDHGDKSIMIENCDDKNPTYLLADPEDCPYNFYRTGPDNSPDFLSQMHHVWFWAVPYLSVTKPMPASRPHCWAYPDMLGIGAPVRGTVAWEQARSRGCANMTMDEERTVFANWAIISSPLVLAIDTTDDDVVAKYYPIVGNEQALAINSEWAGSPGILFKESAMNRSITPTNVTIFAGCTCEAPKVMQDPFPKWTLYAKPLPGGRVAALLINLDDVEPAVGVQLTFSDLKNMGIYPISTSVPSVVNTHPVTYASVDSDRDGGGGGVADVEKAGFSASDVWTGAPAWSGGTVSKKSPFTFEAVSPHNSSFVIFRPL